MPEVATIIFSLLGISVVGLAFTALRLIKSVAQFIAISLLMIFIILLANRSLNPSFGDLAIFSSNRQPSVQTDRQPISLPNLQDYQRSGRELVSGFSKNTGNFSDSLDTFVYGPQAKVGWQRLPEKLYAQQELKRLSAQASQRPINAPSSNNVPRSSNAPSSNPPASSSTTTSTTRPAPAQRPISAWW